MLNTSENDGITIAYRIEKYLPCCDRFFVLISFLTKIIVKKTNVIRVAVLARGMNIDGQEQIRGHLDIFYKGTERDPRGESRSVHIAMIMNNVQGKKDHTFVIGHKDFGQEPNTEVVTDSVAQAGLAAARFFGYMF